MSIDTGMLLTLALLVLGALRGAELLLRKHLPGGLDPVRRGLPAQA